MVKARRLFCSCVMAIILPSMVMAKNVGLNMSPVSPAALPAMVVQVSPPPETSAAPASRPVPPSPPPSIPPAGSLVQMQFDNIELRDLIKFVSNIMGKNFIFDENMVKGRVTILSPKSLSKDEVFRVFESVLNYNGFSVVETPEAIKVVKTADSKSMAVESLRKQTLTDKTPEEKTATLVYPLEYLDSTTMVGILRPLLGRDAYLVGIPATNSLVMADAASNLRRIEKLLLELDIPVSKQLSSIDVYNVQHTNAGDLAKVLQQLLAEGKKAQTPKDKIFVTSYGPTNSLLVSAPAEDMREIRRIIQEIDTFRPQVLVEAAIIEVTMNRAATLGVEWLAGTKTGSDTGVVGGVLASPSTLTGIAGAIISGDPTKVATAAGALPGLSVGVIGNTIVFNGTRYPNLSAFVRALATDEDVNILSTPQLLTMNNEEAEMIVGENRPYLTSTRLDSAGNPMQTFDYRDVGVKLKVKPYINKDGFVNLNIYQEVTKVTEGSVQSGTTSQPAPTTLKRSTKTTVGVKDAQTIVISGLIQDDSSLSRQGIPFLSNIPLLGYLFGTTTRTAQKTNLLIFISPRIVYGSQQLEELSEQMKQRQQELMHRERK